MNVLLAAAVTDGNAFTVSDTEALFTQPVVPVPLTLYTEVLVGDTEIEGVLSEVLQVYVPAPKTVSVAVPWPAQIAVWLETMLSVGNATTDTLITAGLSDTQLLVPVPVTE
jgi:hypothetical protein